MKNGDTSTVKVFENYNAKEGDIEETKDGLKVQSKAMKIVSWTNYNYGFRFFILFAKSMTI